MATASGKITLLTAVAWLLSTGCGTPDTPAAWQAKDAWCPTHQLACRAECAHHSRMACGVLDIEHAETLAVGDPGASGELFGADAVCAESGLPHACAVAGKLRAAVEAKKAPTAVPPVVAVAVSVPSPHTTTPAMKIEPESAGEFHCAPGTPPRACASLQADYRGAARFRCPSGTTPLATGGGGCFCTGPDPNRSVSFDLASCDSHGKPAWQDDDSCFFPCATFTAKREVRTKCHGGRVAHPWSGAVIAARGCTCGAPSGGGPSDPLAPRPSGKCDEIPTADGADCVWTCE